MKEDNLNLSLKLMAKTSVIVFISLVFAKLMGYVYKIIVAREFGPDLYGTLSTALMISGWIILFAGFGLNDGLTRYIAFYRGRNENKKINYIVRWSLIVNSVISLVFGTILYLLAEYLSNSIFKNPELTLFLQIFAFIIPLTVISNNLLAVIRAYEKTSLFSLINNLLQNVIRVLAILGLVFIGIKSSAVSISYLISIVLVFLISYLSVRKYIPEIFVKEKANLKENDKVRKALLAFSFPLLLLSLIGNIFFWTDTLMIGILKDAYSVGLYNVALSISLLLMFATEMFFPLFYPLITREYSRNNSYLVKELSKQIGKWIFLLNLPIFIVMIIFPGVIINVLFGNQYLGAVWCLRILSVGVLTSSIFALSSNMLSIVGKPKTILANTIFFSILNLILNILLIPRYGINGAAIATAISAITLNISVAFFSWRATAIFPVRKKMIRIALVSIIPALLLFYLENSFQNSFGGLVLAGVIFLVVYIGLIILTGCLDRNDLLILRYFKKALIDRIDFRSTTD